MAMINTILQDPERQRMREEAGAWLRKMRLATGLTQGEMAKRLGVKFTFISQLEAGRGRVPPDRYHDWAKVMQLDPREFVRTLLFYYEPVTFEIIFKNERPIGATAV